jgi:hypothetical protein
VVGDDAATGDLVLLPAGSAGPDGFTGDLDLLAAGERAGQAGPRHQLASRQDVEEPVVLVRSEPCAAPRPPCTPRPVTSRPATSTSLSSC